MKKRIISILLSLSILSGSLFCVKRAYAAPALAIGAGVFQIAWQLIGVFTGKYDDAAEAIGYTLQEGWDGLTNPDSPFQQEWSAGWEIICDTVQGWFDSGELTVEDGKVKFTKEQFRELFNQAVYVTGKPEIEFKCGYNYNFLSVDLSRPIKLESLPRMSEYLRYGGEAYSSVYFDDSTIVFSSWYLFLNANSDALSSIFSDCVPSFFASNLSFLQTDFYRYDTLYESYSTLSDCFVYSSDTGSLECKSITDVDTSGMTSGLVTTTGDYPAFLQSIKGITTSLNVPDTVVKPSDIPDNAAVVVPLNPDLDVPISDQIVVSVPDAPDVPITDITNGINIDIDTPSIIVKKFPFCIPFDFVRFLGVLAADPKPPVFKIPINTTLKNPEQWADNQTVAGYINNNKKPMFKINKTIVIDFAHIPLVQPICYTCFIVGFVILLIHITSKMIQH